MDKVSNAALKVPVGRKAVASVRRKPIILERPSLFHGLKSAQAFNRNDGML